MRMKTSQLFSFSSCQLESNSEKWHDVLQPHADYRICSNHNVSVCLHHPHYHHHHHCCSPLWYKASSGQVAPQLEVMRRGHLSCSSVGVRLFGQCKTERLTTLLNNTRPVLGEHCAFLSSRHPADNPSVRVHRDCFTCPAYIKGIQ